MMGAIFNLKYEIALCPKEFQSIILKEDKIFNLEIHQDQEVLMKIQKSIIPLAKHLEVVL